MIEIVASLHPGGDRRDARWLATIQVISTDDGRFHKWAVGFEDKLIGGKLPKARSAHQNLLHVLRDILSDPRIVKLQKDHIKRGGGR